MPNEYLDKVKLNGTVYDIKDTISGYTTNTGTVTDVTAGTGLSGGTINSSGTISLDTDRALTTSDITTGTDTDNKLVSAKTIHDALPTVPTVVDTYSSTGTDAVSGKAVNAALQTLDSSITAETGKAISAIGIVDGKISSSSKISVGDANQNAFSNVKVGTTTIAADTTTDTLELVAGTDITLTPDATNDKVTIAFNNDSGYITGITSSDVTTALGYTPYSNANPSGYTSNTGTVTSIGAGTGLQTNKTSNANITDSGTLSLDTTYALTASDISTGTDTTNKLVSAKTIADAIGGFGGGTVTSVSLTNASGESDFTITGSPITSAGTITIDHANSVTAKTTQALYPITFDKHGHITGAGAAVDPTDTITSWYGTCSTTASTAQKDVTCSNYVLNTGNIIGVLFSTANTAATPTLKVGSTAAKSIYVGASTPSATTNVLKWSANTMIYFMYDGTYYRYLYANAAASVTPPRGANVWYGTGSVSASTQAKTATIDNYVLTKGSLIAINSSTANTYTSAKITLNINSTGAKDVYKNNAVTSSTNTLLWDANTTLLFVYDGTGYTYLGSSRDTQTAGTVTSVQVQATSPVQSSTSTAQSSTLSTTISLADAYGDTKNPYGTKTANYVLAGPTSGSASAPSFRALVDADIPSGYLKSSYTGSNFTSTIEYVDDLDTSGAYMTATNSDHSGTGIGVGINGVGAGIIARGTDQVATSMVAVNTLGDVTVSGSAVTITGVVTPTNDTDAANKKYVDDAVSGITAGVSDVKVGASGSTSSIVSNGVAELITNTAYDSSTNKIATMSDLPTNTDTITTWYGTSSTTASTAEKAVTCSGFDFHSGAIIGVLFSTANTAATPTLNVNTKGAKTIYVGSNTALSDTNPLKWSANTMVYFMYDGTYFRYITSVSSAGVIPSRGANTWYGTSSTGATTAAKVSTINNFVLSTGTLVSITFSTANTYASGAITLNVNSTGAKNVYYNGAVTSSTNTLKWDAGETVTFMYDGSYYHYITKTKGYATSTYSSTGTDPVNGTAVNAALQTLDSSISATTGQAISAITITDGKIASSSKISVGEANQNAFSYVKVGDSTIAADTTTDTLELVAGSNITLTPDTTNDKVTIAATQPTVPTAGTTATAVGTTASGGSATTWSKSDHVHNITSSTITSALGYTPPTDDTKVTNTLGTTTKYYVTGTTSSSTNTGTQYFDTGIYATTTAGQLNATTYKVNNTVTLQWNSTDSSLDFVF